MERHENRRRRQGFSQLYLPVQYALRHWIALNPTLITRGSKRYSALLFLPRTGPGNWRGAVAGTPQKVRARSGVGDAVCVQNVLQRYDADQFVYIGAADHRQQIDLVATHALQRQVQPLIGVHVGKDQLHL
jgi:hypothetical protein